MNPDVGSWNLEWLCHLAGDAGYVLRRHVHEQLVRFCPFGNRAVTFEAAMSDGGGAVESFADNVRSGESFRAFTLRDCGSPLIVRVSATTFHFVELRFPDRFDDGVGIAPLFYLLEII